MTSGKDRGDRPRILIIDDEEEIQSAMVELLHRVGAAAQVLHPQDVGLEDVLESHLVLVDYVLDDWGKRDQLHTPSLQPRRGSSLIAVFRDHLDLRHTEADSVPPIAFALRTGRLEEIPSRFPQPVTYHAYARANNFEWVFDKHEGSSAPARIAELATAVQQLPERWQLEPDGRLGPAERLLNITDQAWKSEADQDVLSCHPPLHELSSASDGLAFLRWFLHRILPYPCFLYDRHRLAVRMGIPVGTLDQALGPPADGSPLAQSLEEARYSGVLGSFLGPRWWRAGVESVLWDATEGEPFNPTALRQLVQASIGDAEATIVRFPVLAIDQAYEYLDVPLEIQQAVRVQPDDWPAYAEDAWTRKELLEAHANLAAIRADLVGGENEEG